MCYHISCFLDCWARTPVRLEDFDRSRHVCILHCMGNCAAQLFSSACGVFFRLFSPGSDASDTRIILI
jgi:hypothetical protein